MSRQQRINILIGKELNPVYLQLDDESHNHHVPQGAETHFKLVIVSEKFEGLSRVTRHRMINHLLAAELNSGLHALSLHLYTPLEWENRGGISLNSPACRGGYAHG